MAADTLLTAIRAHLDLQPTHPVIMEPITRGASGRTIIRLLPDGHPTYIGIHYSLERSDNANYLPVARFLKKSGLRVPEVLYDNIGRQIAIVEDLGNTDLLSLRDKPFPERLPYYRGAFEQLEKLFFTRPPKDFELQPPFDAHLYHWEQDYFIQHFVETHLGVDGQALREDESLASLRNRLGASRPHLVHRDFQSQNLMVKDEKTWVIDFQGLRMGLQEYDLSSLLYDPYLDHSADEQEQLLDLWEDVFEERPIPQILADCATQRLMQALGAYGNLFHNQGEAWYEPHLKTGTRQLLSVIKGTPQESALRPVLEAAL